MQPLPSLILGLPSTKPRFVPPDGGREVQKEREHLLHILLTAKLKNYKMNSCIKILLLININCLKLIRSKMFQKYKVRGKYYHIIIDGTGLATSRKNIIQIA